MAASDTSKYEPLSSSNPIVVITRAGADDGGGGADGAGQQQHGISNNNSNNATCGRRRCYVALLAVHGDEPCGVIAANRLLQSGFFDAVAQAPNCPFDELKLVVGNPRALAAGARFIDANLNRVFMDTTRQAAIEQHRGAGGEDRVPYECARAAELAPLIDECSALLDLHSTSLPTPPFAFYSPAADDGPHNKKSSSTTTTTTTPRPPAEARLALAMPVEFAVRDYTGEGLGLAIERAAQTNPTRCAAACVECGAHGDPASADVAEACLRAFALGRWAGDDNGGGGDNNSASSTKGAAAAAAAAAAPRHVVARTGVPVRRGFRWEYAGGRAPPPAFAQVKGGEVVARDGEAGAIACPAPGGALVVMPAGAPRLGEDALLWAEDYWVGQ